MKKKVRIYKSPTGDGKYINKTSKFLAKAQMGGMPDPSMLGYPGAQQSQQEDPTNQLIQTIVSDISSQIPREKTIFKLVNIMGVASDVATQLYMAVAEQVTQDMEKADDESYEEETGMKREKEAPLSKNEVITENPEEDIDYGFYDDEGSETAMESSNEPDILDEALDPLSDEYKYGGTFQSGGEYGYALPSPDEFDQSNPYEMVSQMAWQSPDMENNQEQVDYPNAIIDYSTLQKGGSYNRTKKKYVNSVMKLLKKQMGGQEGDSENPNNGDPTGANFRENKLQAFTNTVKQNAQMQRMQEQLEQQYDKMMQEGGATEGDFENPMHHLNLYSQATSGIFGEPMNETIKAQDGLNVPKGFYKKTMRRFGNIPNLTKVDVRRSGLFGAPKQYTAYFDPSPLQQVSNPLTAEMYGYGSVPTQQRKQVRTWDAEKVYTNLLVKETNKEALKEVDKNTPGSDATKTEETKEEVVAATAPVVGGPVSSPVVTAPVIPPVVPPVTPPSNEYTFPTPSNQMDWAPGVTKIKQGIENPAVPENKNNQRLPGKPFAYKFIDGQWQYWINDKSPKKVTYQSTLDRLNNNEGKSAVYGTLDANPGYYYRLRNDGSFAKYKGNPEKHNKSSRPVSYITKDDKNYKYLKNNFKESEYLLNYQQQGGSIENPFANPMEPLQRFIGGGMEGNIDYTNSIDTTDPYFQRGGLIKQFVPANLVRNRQNDVVQKIYNPLTGESRPGMAPGAGNYISAIDVRRSSLLNTPKKYTVYYGAQGDPRYENLISLDGSGKSGKQSDKQAAKSAKQKALENAGYGERTDVTGLKGKSKRAIRQGERQRDRELEKLYKEDPTNVEFDPINVEAPFDRTVINNPAYTTQDLVNPTTEEDFATWGTPRDAMETQTAYQSPIGDYNDDAGWGMPQDMVVGPSGIPTTVNQPTADQTQVSTPAPIAKPATGKQTEEFCFGNSCFEVPDQQKTEYDLFYETPELLSDYGRKNNSPWYNPETSDIDLSQLDAETAKKIIKEGIPNNVVLKRKSFDDTNIDAYVDAWLKYSQGNQEAYDDKSWNSLHASPALEGFSAAEKYADFLNATGQTAEGKPYSIWDTTGPLKQTAEQAAARSIKAPYMKRMTSEFAPTSMEGPMSTEQDQIVPFEQQYMEGYKPTITQEMLDDAAQLQLPPQMIDAGAWSGMTGSANVIEPGINPFDLPMGGGEDYYPPFGQPVAPPVESVPQAVGSNRPSLNDLRTQQQRNPNAGKDYTFKPNMSGMEKDPDYRRAMQEARKDGVITNQEANNATRVFKQKQAEQEKAKVAAQAQRTIAQIMNSSASTSEKNKAREKIILQMQQRFDTIDRAANSRKYGGALNRLVKGGEDEGFIGSSPVAYTNNPAMQGKSDLDAITLNQGIQGAQGQVNWGQLSPTNTVTQQNNDGTKSYGVDASYKGTQPTEIKIDPMQQEEYQVAKTYAEPLAIDVENKLTQGQIEGRLNVGNSIVRGITGRKNRRTDNQLMEGFYDNFSANNLYASDPSRDRGDYSDAGIFNPAESGQTWYGRSAQYGGYIGEDPDYTEGDEVYMTEDEIRQYMAQGGQIEFI